MFKKIMAVALTTVAFASAASASDLALPAPKPVYKAPPPTIGRAYVAPQVYEPIQLVFYAGGQIGYGTKSSNGEVVATCLDPLTNTYVLGNQNIDRSYTKAGLHGGIEVPVWMAFVGVEAYGNWGLSRAHVMAGFVDETSRLNDWGIDAVLGLRLWDTGFRIAALLGYGQYDSSFTQNVLGSTFTGKANAGGFQWGFKGDYQFDENWRAVVAYRQTDLPQTQLGQRVGVTDRTVTVGFDYAFGYGGKSRY